MGILFSQNIVGFIGITATVVLGAWALYLAIRYSRRVEITYAHDACISLIDDITQGITQLEIRYQDKSIASNIVLFKGYIINTGKRDIKPEMVEKRLSLVVPDGFEWMDCQIIDKSKDLNISIDELPANSIKFNFGLFKTGEYFKFDALALVPIVDENTNHKYLPPNDRLVDVFGFNYRIADLHKLNFIRISNVVGLRTKKNFDNPLSSILISFLKNYKNIFAGALLAVTGIAFFFIVNSFDLKVITYKIEGSDNNPIIVRAKIEKEKIIIYNNNGFRKDLLPEDFDRLEKCVVLKKFDNPITIYVTMFYVGLGILFFLFQFITFIRLRKYRKILIHK